MLGPSGSGKTVFLASMYKKLSTQGEHGFFLEIDGAEKRKRLNNIYKLKEYIVNTKRQVGIEKQTSKKQSDLSQNLAIEKSHPKITSDDSSHEGSWIIIFCRFLEYLAKIWTSR